MSSTQIVFTTHAEERRRQRSIPVEAIKSTVLHPHKTYPGKQAGTTKFLKTVNQRRLHVVAQYLKDEKKWLIISVWVRGEDDQPSLSWQLLTLPFRLGWWILQKLFNKPKASNRAGSNRL